LPTPMISFASPAPFTSQRSCGHFYRRGRDSLFGNSIFSKSPDCDLEGLLLHEPQPLPQLALAGENSARHARQATNIAAAKKKANAR